MALTAKHPARHGARAFGALGSALVPFAVLTSHLDDHGALVERGAELSASVTLRLSPGGGLPSLLLSHLAQWLPIGSLSLRAVFASALCMAVTAALVFLACETLARVQGASSAWSSVALGLGGAWTAVAFEPAFREALLPGPHALSLALGALVLERIATLEANWPTRDRRPMASAALGFGLLLANEPAAALWLLPALAPSLSRAWRSQRQASMDVSWLVATLGASCLGLAVLRGAELPQALFAPQPFAAPELWRALYQASPLWLALAALGAVRLLRAPGAHRLGHVFTMACLVPVLVATLLQSFALQPVTAGSYLIGGAAIAVLAVSALAELLAGRAPLPLAALLSAAVALLGASGLVRARREVSPDGRALDRVLPVLRDALPNRALVLGVSPDMRGLFEALQAEQRDRPDLAFVALGASAEPGHAERLAVQYPELQPLLRTYLLEGAFSEAALQSVGGLRPLALELDQHVAPELYPGLLPRGLWHEVPDAEGSEPELRDAEQRLSAMHEALHARLVDATPQPALSRLLARHHYFAALYLLGRGRLESARAELDHARRLLPAAEPLAALERALDRADADTDADVDVRPLLVPFP